LATSIFFRRNDGQTRCKPRFEIQHVAAGQQIMNFVRLHS